MLVVMAYSVAYLGVLSPDRVIKHDLIHYLLRGPVVGIAGDRRHAGDPPRRADPGAAARHRADLRRGGRHRARASLAVNAGQALDRPAALSRRISEEIAWIQTLDRRLLTSSDLRQFLTNVLIGLCELLRVRDGFVLVQTDDGLRVEAVVG